MVLQQHQIVSSIFILSEGLLKFGVSGDKVAAMEFLSFSKIHYGQLILVISAHLFKYNSARAGDRILGPCNSQGSRAPHAIDYCRLDDFYC